MSKAKTGYKAVLRRYYCLAKPGIVYGNVMTASAGYIYASGQAFHIVRFLSFIVGIAWVIAAACAYNNVLDRRIDGSMRRTKTRSTVTGMIAPKAALLFASICLILGSLALFMGQNWLTIGLIGLAFVDYVILYGIGKRHSVHGTLIGCISGAIPMVAGYTAVTNRLDLTAAALFVLMVCWQMAHFYGIALYRIDDYRAAGLPVMPVVHGVRATQLQTFIYIVLFNVVLLYLMVSRSLSIVAGGLLIGLWAWWFMSALRSRKSPTNLWGKQVFVNSLTVILGVSVMMAVNPWLP